MLNKATESLAGGGLVQSPQEWDVRNTVMTDTLSALVNRYVMLKHNRALDVGCQHGVVTDMYARKTHLKWWGIDPGLQESRVTAEGSTLSPGWGHEISSPDNHFDCVMFANVYEHVDPAQRVPTLAEMYRVLDKGGILVGQLPNPYFPIESHSRLPFMGWLPQGLQKRYWKLSPMSNIWEHNFYTVTVYDMKREAESLGYETVEIVKFNYPLDVIPKDIRKFAALATPVMKIFPWAWQFVFRKPLQRLTR